jgi:hypothetical protein
MVTGGLHKGLVSAAAIAAVAACLFLDSTSARLRKPADAVPCAALTPLTFLPGGVRGANFHRAVAAAESRTSPEGILGIPVCCSPCATLMTLLIVHGDSMPVKDLLLVGSSSTSS